MLESARSKLTGTGYRSGATRNAYGNRYGASGTRLNGASSTLDKSISYLTTSDFHARTASRAKASREKELEELEEPEKVATNKQEEQVQQKLQAEQQQEQTADPPEQETFVSVSVVTRATSPTPPGSSTVQRTRRIDIAKTIEKTIKRSTRPRQMLEKEIQSDRLDDSTRYLRYSGAAAGSSSSNYSSPHRDRISSLRYSASPLSSSSSKTSSSGPAELKQNHSMSPVPETVPGKISSCSSSQRSSSKSKLSPPKAVRLASRQSSVENLVNKPPAAPSKAESPTKSIAGSSSSSSSANSSANSSSLAKWPWPNKDFRKSSLNVGPTDRPRQSRTPSSGASESEEPGQQQEPERELERSPSEASVASASCSNRKPAKLANGSRSTSTSSRSLKSHKSCTPGSGGTASSAACSSSDSEQQRGKAQAAKKPSKKKSTTNGGQHKEKATKQQQQQPEKREQKEEEAEKEEKQGVRPAAERGESTQNSSQSAATDSRSHAALQQQRLSAVSNFLASRHHDANSEPIFLESSESAGEADPISAAVPSQFSLTLSTRTNETIPSEVTQRVASPATIATTTTTTTNPTKTASNSLSGSSTHLPRETTSLSESKSRQLASLSSEAQESLEEPSWWQDTSLQINTASALAEMPYRLRHIDSGDEQAWWLRDDEDDTLAEESHNPLDDEQDVSAATETQTEHSKGQSWWSGEEQQNGHATQREREEQQQQLEEQQQEQPSARARHMPRSRISPEQAAWWLDEEPPSSGKQNGFHKQAENGTDAHVEVTIKLPSGSSSRSKLAPSQSQSQSSDSNGHWWLSGPAKKLFNVQRVESGERAWWQEKENEPPPTSAPQAAQVKPPTPPPRIIKHWESGERAWWLQDEQAEEEQPTQPTTATPPGQDQLDYLPRAELSSSFNFAYSVRPPPLGQCASPVPHEQLEQTELAEEQRKLCTSPYDNIPMSKVQSAATPPPAAAQSTAPPPSPPVARYSCHYTPPPPARVGEKLFISRHQNIDELLGGACRPLSPLFSGVAAGSADGAEPPAAKNMFLLEEITPDQVRIHDSTAQLPVIKRMQR